MIDNKTILVCVDEKKNSEIALKFACKKAAKIRASLEMLYVIDIDQQSFLSIIDTARQEKLSKAENMMQEYLKKAQEWANISIKYKIKEGLAEEEITKAVEQDSNINMVVLGAPSKASESVILPILAKLENCLMLPLMIIPGNLTDQQILELE